MSSFTFEINYKTQPGQVIMLTGSVSEIGNWNKGIAMEYKENGVWKVSLRIVHIPFEYKYYVFNVGTNQIERWEDSDNRRFFLTKPADIISIVDEWGAPSNTKTVQEKAKVVKTAIKKSTSRETNKVSLK